MDALPFAHWESFYVIVGTSVAALTGLQFVVMTLVAEFRPERTVGEIDAYATPTIVHFSVVLFISGVLGAPWHGYLGAAILLGLTGMGGAVYEGFVIGRAMRTTGYRPVLEDWIFHAALPMVAYVTLFVASVFVARGHPQALFAVGGTALLLMFVGIHNAWDTVTYITLEGRKTSGTSNQTNPSP
jgi:hypothetical protein